MQDKTYKTPQEITEGIIEIGIKKTSMSVSNLFVLGFLAGIFTAFASEGSSMASFNLLANPDTYGIGRVMTGAVFGTGLMMVVVAGGELFPGNCLIIAGVLNKRIKISKMLRNWVIVYIANFLGSLLIAYMMNKSGLFSSGANTLGGMTIKIASYKVGLSFSEGFFLGLMCNCLICLAVLMASGAHDISGKIWGVFFPIWLFVTSGFENSIANMYYIPAGIIAKNNEVFANSALELGMTAENLDKLNWGSFVTNNLVPVTLGNIVGGGLFIAAAYWFVYVRKNEPVK